jgi:hypothetical protein
MQHPGFAEEKSFDSYLSTSVDASLCVENPQQRAKTACHQAERHVKAAELVISLAPEQQRVAGKGFDLSEESMSAFAWPPPEHVEENTTATATERADMHVGGGSTQQAHGKPLHMVDWPDKEVDAMEKYGCFWENGRLQVVLR